MLSPEISIYQSESIQPPTLARRIREHETPVWKKWGRPVLITAGALATAVLAYHSLVFLGASQPAAALVGVGAIIPGLWIHEKLVGAISK